MPLLPSCGCGRYLNELHVKYEKLEGELISKKTSKSEIKRIIGESLQNEDIRYCCKMKIRFHINTDSFDY
jgi:hypothetical protein